MGTYRTNQAIAVAAYLIDSFTYYADTNECEVNLKPTKFTEFASPVYCDHKWTLGEITEEVTLKDRPIPVQQFRGRPLYKVVQRDGQAYLMFLQLTGNSQVYSGASAGCGIYFETDINEALQYINTRGGSLDWTDPEVSITDDDLKEHEELKQSYRSSGDADKELVRVKR